MPITYEIDENIVVITIDRVNAMNALDGEHNEALRSAFKRYQTDPDLRAAVVTGAGDVAFSAGADLKQLLPSVRDAALAGGDPEWHFGGITADSGPKPVIAAVNGHALAGGLELALACDIRLAAPNATFGLAETKWAVTPGAGGTVRLPQLIPVGIAMEMALTGEPIDAYEAYRVGLVNRIIDLERLREEAVRLARTIATRGPLAVQSTRQSIIDGLGVPMHVSMQNEHRRFVEILRTQDAIEGSTAFSEKRPPRYIGR